VFQEDAAFHVVPRMIVDVRGVVAEVHSVLDAKISLQPGEKNLAEVVAATAAATTAAGADAIGASNAAADISSSRRPISWRLLYDPGMRKYVLNLHIRD
jgi:hypothetical protein